MVPMFEKKMKRLQDDRERNCFKRNADQADLVNYQQLRGAQAQRSFRESVLTRKGYRNIIAKDIQVERERPTPITRTGIV